MCSECAQNHGAHIFKRNKFLPLPSASCDNVIQRINESENVRYFKHGSDTAYITHFFSDCHINVSGKRSTVRGLWSPVPPDLNVTQDAGLVHSPLSAQGLKTLFEESSPVLHLNSADVSALSLRYYRIVAWYGLPVTFWRSVLGRNIRILSCLQLLTTQCFFHLIKTVEA